jgi:hypothetical protein
VWIRYLGLPDNSIIGRLVGIFPLFLAIRELKAKMTTMHNLYTESQALNDYQEALNQAFWRKVRQWLGRGCNDLLSFDEVFQYLKRQPQSELGLQLVPLEQIVGSSGRHHDFDLAYNPRRKSSDNRWVNIAKAKYQGAELSSVSLYKVGEAYFVEDGNHRISVARVYGEEYIRATVIEIDVSSFRPETKCTRLGYKINRGENRVG